MSQESSDMLINQLHNILRQLADVCIHTADKQKKPFLTTVAKCFENDTSIGFH